MNITICESLKEYRKNKGNTQEDIAEYLGISIQAVSKWERGEGFPDITLLPNIALYYNVSVDDLLGVGKIQLAKKIEEYRQRSNAASDDREKAAIWKEAVYEFPNDLSVLHYYMGALFSSDKNNEEFNYTDEIIKTGERLLNESVYDWQRYSAIQLLCYTYSRTGNFEKAKEYAGRAPIYYVTSHELYTRALQGEEAVANIQGNIMQLTDLIELNICQELMRKKEFANKEKIYMYNYVLNLFGLLFSDGDFGFYYCRTSNCYIKLAGCYADEKDLENTIKNLSLSAEHLIKYITQPDYKHTSFLVNKHEYKRDNSSSNNSKELLEDMQEQIYDFCRGDKRFIAIEEKLKKYE